VDCLYNFMVINRLFSLGVGFQDGFSLAHTPLEVTVSDGSRRFQNVSG
jgi:hypothetical protein